jgi:hypothetical protein
VKKGLLFLLLLVLSTLAQSQNLSGFWKGTLTMPGGCFAVNNIELQIQMDGTSATGNSYHYLDINNYVKKNMSGVYDPTTKKIQLQEDLVTTFNIRPDCKICIKNFELFYRREGNKEFLMGGWKGKIAGTGGVCDNGNIVLSRIRESAFKEIPEVLVDTGQLRLDFYDNNQVDGDSITVRVNGKTLLTNQLLTTKPITMYVNIDLKNTFQEVEMIAENEGSIPPNTALLIVTAGEKRYQLFLTSTEVKSAKVRFVYDVAKQSMSSLKPSSE